MVISSSSWMRPAQAVIYTESGEALHFPPLNCRGLPRALTFVDWPGPGPAEKSDNRCQTKTDAVADDNAFSPSYYSYADDPFSFFLTSNASKDDIEDPPEAYESFEVDCTQLPISKNAEEICMDYGIPYMSTPTECYSNKLKQHQCQLSPKLKAPLPSGSEACPSSPLIQTGTTAYLSLDELVDIYTERMEEARRTRAFIAKHNELYEKLRELRKEDTKSSVVEQCNMEPGLAETNQTPSCSAVYEGANNTDNAEEQRICTKGSSTSVETERSFNSPTAPLQLIAFDTQKLLQKLDDLFDHDDSRDEDKVFISKEELDSLLMSCRSNNYPECGSR